ncbi:MAG: hypothetical protein EP298_09385 [Gammaproteobacteria bacterium]|nr:MAG: hypothetical protein EP298_09385 [Gammaproteobacteria bacterium]UTW42307.1 hypothetical protein KFE69_12600 [bacterium SCSIO 12844]
MALTQEQQDWFERAKIIYHKVDDLAYQNQEEIQFENIYDHVVFLTTNERSSLLINHEKMQDGWEKLNTEANELFNLHSADEAYILCQLNSNKSFIDAFKLQEINSNLRSIGGQGGNAVQGEEIAMEVMGNANVFMKYPNTCQKFGIEYPTSKDFDAAARNSLFQWQQEKMPDIDLHIDLDQLSIDDILMITNALSAIDKANYQLLTEENVINIIESEQPQIVAAELLIRGGLQQAQTATGDLNKRKIADHLLTNMADNDLVQTLCNGARAMSHHTNLFKSRSTTTMPKAYQAAQPYFEKARELLNISDANWRGVLKNKPNAFEQLAINDERLVFSSYADQKNQEVEHQLDQ